MHLAGVRSIDLVAEICATGTCGVEKGDAVVYRDSHHLTASFAASLADEMGGALDEVVAGTLGAAQ